MKITIFTSNQPRHIALIEELARVSSELYLIQECTTVHPGRVSDFYNKSEIMKNYFLRVIKAEKEIFGISKFIPNF